MKNNYLNSPEAGCSKWEANIGVQAPEIERQKKISEALGKEHLELWGITLEQGFTKLILKKNKQKEIFYINHVRMQGGNCEELRKVVLKA